MVVYNKQRMNKGRKNPIATIFNTWQAPLKQNLTEEEKKERKKIVEEWLSDPKNKIQVIKNKKKSNYFE